MIGCRALCVSAYADVSPFPHSSYGRKKSAGRAMPMGRSDGSRTLSMSAQDGLILFVHSAPRVSDHEASPDGQTRLTAQRRASNSASVCAAFTGCTQRLDRSSGQADSHDAPQTTGQDPLIGFVSRERTDFNRDDGTNKKERISQPLGSFVFFHRKLAINGPPVSVSGPMRSCQLER